jgi:hypothetical protein
MKDKVVYVLLEDDTEILGNGYGHVMYRMYLPVIKYIDILNRYNAKSTFYIEMAHWLFLRANSEKKDYGIQADLIEKTIFHILENNMEVQLHLHSQWVNALVQNDEIHVTEKWNIGQLNTYEQKKLFTEGLYSLRKIITKSKNQNKISSFKAGAWALQPFDVLFDDFKNVGIKVVLGPIKDLKISAIELDYSSMESHITPYYCDKNNINKIGDKKGIVILPMTPTYLNWFDFIRYLIHRKYKGLIKKFDHDLDIIRMPEEARTLNPLTAKDRLNSLLIPYKTNLKMNHQPYWFLRKTFKRAYNLVQKNNFDYKLIILETHTKDFKNSFKDIEKFFAFMTENYNIKFITATDFARHIEEGRLEPLSKK